MDQKKKTLVTKKGNTVSRVVRDTRTSAFCNKTYLVNNGVSDEMLFKLFDKYRPEDREFYLKDLENEDICKAVFEDFLNNSSNFENLSNFVYDHLGVGKNGFLNDSYFRIILDTFVYISSFANPWSYYFTTPNGIKLFKRIFKNDLVGWLTLFILLKTIWISSGYDNYLFQRNVFGLLKLPIFEDYIKILPEQFDFLQEFIINIAFAKGVDMATTRLLLFGIDKILNSYEIEEISTKIKL